MTIKVGDKIPNATLRYMTAEGIKTITTDELFKGKRVVLFAVPGAFTPTCSKAHLPGFVVNADAIKEKDVDRIIGLSVNDAFVKDAWGKDQNVHDNNVKLAGGQAEFPKAGGREGRGDRWRNERGGGCCAWMDPGDEHGLHKSAKIFVRQCATQNEIHRLADRNVAYQLGNVIAAHPNVVGCNLGNGGLPSRISGSILCKSKECCTSAINQIF